MQNNNSPIIKLLINYNRPKSKEISIFIGIPYGLNGVLNYYQRIDNSLKAFFYLCRIILLDGVIGNTFDVESEESWFESLSGNKKKRLYSLFFVLYAKYFFYFKTPIAFPTLVKASTHLSK